MADNKEVKGRHTEGLMSRRDALKAIGTIAATTAFLPETALAQSRNDPLLQGLSAEEYKAFSNFVYIERKKLEAEAAYVESLARNAAARDDKLNNNPYSNYPGSPVIPAPGDPRASGGVGFNNGVINAGIAALGYGARRIGVYEVSGVLLAEVYRRLGGASSENYEARYRMNQNYRDRQAYQNEVIRRSEDFERQSLSTKDRAIADNTREIDGIIRRYGFDTNLRTRALEYAVAELAQRNNVRPVTDTQQQQPNQQPNPPSKRLIDIFKPPGGHNR